MIIKIIFFFISLILPGWLLLKLFWPKQVNGVLKTLALAYGLGWGLITVQAFIAFFWLKWPLGNWLIWLWAIEDLLLLAAYLVVKQIKIRQLPISWRGLSGWWTEFKTWALVEKFLLLIILLFAAVALANGLSDVLIAWDSVVNWSLKAMAILKNQQAIFDSGQSSYWLNFAYPNYPWNISLSFAWLGYCLGGFNEIANNLLYFGFYLACLVLIYDCLRQFCQRRVALLFTMFAASSGLFVYHSFSAYGELPLAFFALAGFSLLLGAIRRPAKAAWLLAGIIGGLATLTKNEGIFYVLAAPWLIWLTAKGLAKRELLKRLGLYLAGFIVSSGAWWLFKLVNHLGIQNTDSGFVWHPESLLSMLSFWTAYSDFNIFWPILFFILVYNWRQMTKQRLLRSLWLYWLAIVLCFIYVYVFSKAYVYALNCTTISRNALTYFPIAVILAGLTFDSKLLSGETIEEPAIDESETLPNWLALKFSQTPWLVNNKKIIKFLVVGTLGAIIDFGLLALLVEIFHWPPLAANTVSFSVAVVNNFLLNKFWTWRDGSLAYKKQFAKFTFVSVVGLLISTLLLWLFIAIKWHYLLGKVITAIIVAFWNYIINDKLTFSDKNNL